MTYAQSGVNLQVSDKAARIASRIAQTTFTTRQKALIGRPVKLPNGFAGALDCGDFLLVNCTDGTGTKMAVAELTRNFATIGQDLLAMVVDDAVCLGAEGLALTNTLDAPKIQPVIVRRLLQSLARVCRKQRIVINGGELAEVGATVNSLVWNATLVGVVSKTKLLTGAKIQPGDVILALREKGLRSNGFTLARQILATKFGPKWFQRKFRGQTWGKLLLTPSQIYSQGILALHGPYGEKAQVALHGIAHVTGGGIIGNLPRIFPTKKLGAHFFDLWPSPDFVAELRRLGGLTLLEARRAWNLGNGMLLVLNAAEADKAIQILKTQKIAARVAGEINTQGKITFSE